MKVKVISLFEPQTDPKGLYVNTTSSAAEDWQRDLSPFFLGPILIPGRAVSLNFENLWQYAKVYPGYDFGGKPTPEYFEWALEGWGNPRAVRYPMGKGKIPLYSFWDGKKLDYIRARKIIYAPYYIHTVQRTNGWKHLLHIFQTNTEYDTIYLRDYDAYRHEDFNMSLTDVLNNPKEKMGHAFVLAMMLLSDPALNELTFV